MNIRLFPFSPNISWHTFVLFALVLDLGREGLGALDPCGDDDRQADDSHKHTKEHHNHRPDGVKRFERPAANLEVEDAGENKQEAGGCCRSDNSKNISDIRDKDGQHQHHAQDDQSCQDVDQP